LDYFPGRGYGNRHSREKEPGTIISNLIARYQKNTVVECTGRQVAHPGFKFRFRIAIG
jgi:hypothetical protein